MKNYIGENVRYLKHESRLSQDEFGSLFGLGTGVISKYERGISNPLICTVQSICKYYNISIDDFINVSLEDLNKLGVSTIKKELDSFAPGEIIVSIIKRHSEFLNNPFYQIFVKEIKEEKDLAKVNIDFREILDYHSLDDRINAVEETQKGMRRELHIFFKKSIENEAELSSDIKKMNGNH
jgi:transcriptional regulator with XRE-family HTH domain